MIQAPVGRNGGFTGIFREGGVGGGCKKQCGWVKKTMQSPSCLASHL